MKIINLNLIKSLSLNNGWIRSSDISNDKVYLNYELLECNIVIEESMIYLDDIKKNSYITKHIDAWFKNVIYTHKISYKKRHFYTNITSIRYNLDKSLNIGFKIL